MVGLRRSKGGGSPVCDFIIFVEYIVKESVEFVLSGERTCRLRGKQHWRVLDFRGKRNTQTVFILIS